MSFLTIKQQTQSKLGQRDRLSAEKKIIAEFLDEIVSAPM
uniref:Uncharacterized protein n=2 Tax=Vibrio TaxID=662 RepID=A0A0H3ZQ06_9VIBR|nr:hypothetical protein [Vibrio tasmaniensis]AKN38356.1 hypothetical protein [Vibrio sp. FF_371]